MKQTATLEQYEQAFALERRQEYPAVDAIERHNGYAIDRAQLEDMARILACPVKANPPNWQHGRVVYALLRKYLDRARDVQVLDIGTAKGYSAAVMGWALYDAGQRRGIVHSVDMIDPDSREIRNTVAEVDGLKTLRETVHGFLPPEIAYQWYGGGSLELLYRLIDARERINFAFVDGKHARGTVMMEADCLAKLQKVGDLVLFDDMQIPEVQRGVNCIEPKDYAVEVFWISPTRAYALATRL